MDDDAKVLAEKAKHEEWISRQQGVVGTGYGLNRDGHPCVKIYTNHLPRTTAEQIAERLGEVPFEFEETGEFLAF